MCFLLDFQADLSSTAARITVPGVFQHWVLHLEWSGSTDFSYLFTADWEKKSDFNNIPINEKETER